jgi:hypothetical protein
VRHCRRTYAYALAFARDRPFDTERLFVASMLHDAGLTDGPQASVDDVAGPAQGQGEEPCFAVRGARLADRLARTHGWSSSSRDRLAEAISLHLNVFARSRYGIEAEILSAASAFDAIRLRSRQVDREWVRTVEARWPRGQSFCDGLRGAWRRESLTHPDCRAAFLDPWGFFEAWIGRTCRVE